MGHMHESCVSLMTIPDYAYSSGVSLTYFCNGCTSLASHAPITVSNVADKNSMLRSCLALRSSVVDMSNTTTAYAMYNGNTSIRTVVWTNASIQSIEYICTNCGALLSAVLGDMTGVLLTTNAFLGCVNLAHVEMNNLAVSTALINTYLRRESLLGVITNLVDLSGQTAQTLTLGAANLAKLTVDERAIATAKNWLLV